MNNILEAIENEVDVLESSIKSETLDNQNLQYKFFKNSNFDKCNYEKITFTDCYFDSITISNSMLLNITFINCRFNNCEIRNCKLTGDSFYESEIKKCSLEDSVIQMGSSEKNDIKYNNYTEISFIDNKFENSNYSECIF